MKVKCPKCQRKLDVQEKSLGKTVECPCGQSLKTRAVGSAKHAQPSNHQNQEVDLFDGVDFSSSEPTFTALRTSHAPQNKQPIQRAQPRSQHSLLQAAEAEDKANQRRTSKGNRKAILTLVVALLAIPIVGAGAAMVGYVINADGQFVGLDSETPEPTARSSNISASDVANFLKGKKVKKVSIKAGDVTITDDVDNVSHVEINCNNGLIVNADWKRNPFNEYGYDIYEPTVNIDYNRLSVMLLARGVIASYLNGEYD